MNDDRWRDTYDEWKLRAPDWDDAPPECSACDDAGCTGRKVRTMSAFLDLPKRPLAEVLARKTCGGCEHKADPSMPIAVCRNRDIAVSRSTPACDDYAEAEDDGPDGDDIGHGDVGSAGQ